MTKSNIDPSKKALDKTDWKKVIGESQEKTERESISDKDNPILVNKKFKKSTK